MKATATRSKQTLQSKANANPAAQQPATRGTALKSPKAPLLAFEDNRPETLVQRKRQSLIDSSPKVAAQRKWQELADNSPQIIAQQKRQEAVGNSPHIVAQHTSHAGNSVVQRAGTKPNQPSVDGKYRIKLSSDREKFTYDNRVALGLDAVLPGHHEWVLYNLNKDGKVVSVQLKDLSMVYLETPIPEPTGGKELLVIDTVGYEEPEEVEEEEVAESKKLFIDIKIGHYTKSGQQFKLEGAGIFMRRFKQLEHDLKDTSRTSDVSGYDIDSKNLKAFTTAHKRAKKKQEPSLGPAMKAVWAPLNNIRKAMARAPVTFVGSSVFIVLNLTNPENSAVKLIDPDHPIVLKKPDTIGGLGPVPDDVTTSDKMSSGRSWNEYVKKWTWNFGSGMVKFMQWYKARYNEIPGD